MRSGDAERGLRPQGAPAPQRGHSPASIVRRANLAYSAPVELNVDGTVDMRSGGSVLKAPRRRRGGTPPPRASSASRQCGTCASIVRKPSQQTAYGYRKGSQVSRRAFSVCARTSETKPRRHSGYAERGLRPQGAPAPQRGHSPASIVHVPAVQENCTVSQATRASARILEPLVRNF